MREIKDQWRLRLPKQNPKHSVRFLSYGSIIFGMSYMPFRNPPLAKRAGPLRYAPPQSPMMDAEAANRSFTPYTKRPVGLLKPPHRQPMNKTWSAEDEMPAWVGCISGSS